MVTGPLLKKSHAQCTQPESAMRLVASLLFIVCFPLELLAQISNDYTVTSWQGHIYKICVVGPYPRHSLSLWINPGFYLSQVKVIEFRFDLDHVNTILMQSFVGGSELAASEQSIFAFPRNYDNGFEFLYYVTFYMGGAYFSVPTTDAQGVQIVIDQADDWWKPESNMMKIACDVCTSIDFSLLNWGKTDADLWKLAKKAEKLSPYYNKTTALISNDTIAQLEKHYPNPVEKEL